MSSLRPFKASTHNRLRIIVQMLAKKRYKLFHFLFSKNQVGYRVNFSRTGTSAALQSSSAAGNGHKSKHGHTGDGWRRCWAQHAVSCIGNGEARRRKVHPDSEVSSQSQLCRRWVGWQSQRPSDSSRPPRRSRTLGQPSPCPRNHFLTLEYSTRLHNNWSIES